MNECEGEKKLYFVAHNASKKQNYYSKVKKGKNRTEKTTILKIKKFLKN